MRKEKEPKNAIPEFVVLPSDQEKWEEEFSQCYIGLCDSYEKLKQIEDLADVITDNVQDIMPAPVNSFIDDRISEIVSTKMLTVEAKEKAKRDWEVIRQTAIPLITSIHKFFESYPLANVVLEEGKMVITNRDEVMFESCKRSVPQQTVTQHYELIKKVRDAIVELWNFERINDWPSDNLVNLDMDLKLVENPNHLAGNWVYRSWLREYRKNHPYLDGAYDIAKKSSLAEQNARLSAARKKHLEEHPEDFIEIGKKNPYDNMRGSSVDYSSEMK